MPLPSSGTISAGQINVELGNAASATLGLGSAYARALAAVPSGQIGYGSFYGKSAETITWNTPSGSVGTRGQGGINVSSSISASSSLGNTITYSLFSGSLPAGLTLNSNGTITGNISAGAATGTYNFTARATSTLGNRSDRAFSFTVIAPIATGDIELAAPVYGEGQTATFSAPAPYVISAVTYAWYGPSNGGSGSNVTSLAIIQAAVGQTSYSLTVNNTNMGGDPTPGVGKGLWANWTYA